MNVEIMHRIGQMVGYILRPELKMQVIGIFLDEGDIVQYECRYISDDGSIVAGRFSAYELEIE